MTDIHYQIMQYHTVVVLNASPIDPLTGEFDVLQKGMYLGGDVRMLAAKSLSQKSKNFIFVGGDEKKVTDMRDFFLGSNPDSHDNLIRLVSEPDTNGNLWAVKLFFEKIQLEPHDKRVGLLTNFYHLPRAMRMASEILQDFCIIPISAESVVSTSKPMYSSFPTEYLLRIAAEIQGLKDWEDGRYRNQEKNLTPEFWNSEPLDDEWRSSV